MNLSLSKPAPQSEVSAPAGRGFWPMRDLPTVVWLLATVIAVIAHRQIPVPRWLMVHLLLLGAITHAILVWSQYFSFALLRSRATVRDRRHQNWRLILSNLGALLVCVGVPSHVWALTVVGAGLLVVAVSWHAVSLIQRRRVALPGKFGRTTSYYITASVLLVGGLTIGAIVARGDAPQLVLAHALLNVLGWVGLTVAGTVVTLWPTILRTRADELAPLGARRALPLLAAGTLFAAGGAGFAEPAVLGVGLALYLAGLLVLGVSLWRAARQVKRVSFAALSVGAALTWWVGIIAWLLVGTVVLFATGEGYAGVSGLIRASVPYLAAGFAVQVLIGALSYLVPVVLGGGPHAVRVGTEAFDRLGVLRVTLANAALLVCALPVNSLLRVIASVIYLVAVASFLVVLMRAMRAQRRAKSTAQPHETPAQAGRAALTVSSRGAVAGQFVSGLVAVVVAVAIGAAVDSTGLGQGAAAQGAADAPVQTVQIDAKDMRFTPNEIEVPVGTRLVIELTNTDAELTHDLVFSNGVQGQRLGPGESETIDVGVITEGLEGWCSIVGHRQMGMTLTVTAVGADEGSAAESGAHESSGAGAHHAADVIDLMAPLSDGFEAYDARLTPLPDHDGPQTHHVTLRAQDTVQEVAAGVTQTLWTFGSTAPGPVLHGRVGDVFEVELINDTTMGHSIDFHAGSLAPDEPMRTIGPGERLVYTFTATRAGIWMYHCSTMPMSAHIANGMYGAVIIEPDDLPEVDHSYVLVQGEYYLGSHDGGEVDVEKIATRNPDLVVFNGTANQYDEAPLAARVGERVRFWVLDAGIERASSFHVVGGQFDTVWFEGGYLLQNENDTGSQALALASAQGGFVELTFPEAGSYPFVSHYMIDAERGAHGIVRIE